MRTCPPGGQVKWWFYSLCDFALMLRRSCAELMGEHREDFEEELALPEYGSPRRPATHGTRVRLKTGGRNMVCNMVGDSA